MARKKVTIEDLAGMVKRGFDSVDKRFEQVDQRFDSVDKRFEQVDKRFEQVDKRFEQVDKRFDNLENRMEAGFAHVNARLDTIRHDISDLPAMRASLRDLHQRVERLEHKAVAR